MKKSNKTKSYDKLYYGCSIFRETRVQGQLEKRPTTSLKQRL